MAYRSSPRDSGKAHYPPRYTALKPSSPTFRHSSKIARVLPEFKPQWDVRKGAEQLYQAYPSSGRTLEEFEGPRSRTISHIKKLMAEGILDADLRHMGVSDQYGIVPAVAAE